MKKKQKTIQIQVTIDTEEDSISESEVFSKDVSDNGGYKQCPYCGQSKVSFKLGVCICGKQVGKIQYVDDTQRYANQWYSYVGDRTEKYDAAEEAFADLKELDHEI